MAWIESHQTLEKHPKVFDLMHLMGWDVDQTIGKLHRFWWWCVDYAEDGDLQKHNDARIAAAVGLNGEQGKIFVENMVKSCWIDRDPYFRVHEWWNYFGRFLQVKYKHNPNEWRKIRKLYKNGSYNRTPNLTKPNLTKPNQTKPNLTVITQNEVLLASFGGVLTEKIKVYLDRVAKKNKSKIITEGRKQTLLNELFNTRSLCNDDELFGYALEQSIGRDACCIGYINAVIKNKKTKRPL